MKVLVVDDEAPARRRLARLLAELGGIEVVGEAGTGLEALGEIQRRAPDGVFLDVRMPDLDGLTLARASAVTLPPVVFVTAHDEFAIAAFEVNAVDYLLKPVRRERLAVAVERLRQRVAARATPAAPADGEQRVLEALTEREHGGGSPRIVCCQRDVLRFFDARALSRIWAQDKYSVFLAEGAEQITDESLSSLEQRLGTFGFVRTHRAELINVARVTALEVADGVAEVQLADGQRARVSRRLLAGLKSALGV